MKRDVNLLDIIHLLRKRWWIMLIAAIVLAVGAVIYSEITYKPTYTTTVKIYVKGDLQSTEGSSANDDVSAATWAQRVVKNYMEILKSEDFMEIVSTKFEKEYSEDWEEQEYGSKWLSNSVKFQPIENTSIFTVSITTKYKDHSLHLGKVFEEEASKHIEDITGKKVIEISDHAREASSPTNDKNLVRNVVMGVLIGVLASFLVVFIIDISDVRIKKEEDIVDNYPVPLLGTIPNFEVVMKNKKKGHGFNHGKK